MKIREIYITNRTASGVAVPCSPCGACRQVIAEFATADTLIHYHGEDGIVCKTMAELLPDSFTFSR
jgi:cytidine deaminase